LKEGRWRTHDRRRVIAGPSGQTPAARGSDRRIRLASMAWAGLSHGHRSQGPPAPLCACRSTGIERQRRLGRGESAQGHHRAGRAPSPASGLRPVLAELDGQETGRLPRPGARQEARGPAHALNGPAHGSHSLAGKGQPASSPRSFPERFIRAAPGVDDLRAAPPRVGATPRGDTAQATPIVYLSNGPRDIWSPETQRYPITYRHGLTRVDRKNPQVDRNGSPRLSVGRSSWCPFFPRWTPVNRVFIYWW
jgi:hypothetical protein